MNPSRTDRFLLAPFAFYCLAIALGLALRVFFVRPFALFDFGHAVHAHSHTLYFGWVGLGICALAFARIGRESRTLLGALAAVSAATFVAFLEGGYALPGIVVSTCALLVWATAVVAFLRGARGQGGVDVAFLRAGMAYAGLASLGAWARVAILAARVSDPLPGKLAVFAFLHDFAWFFVLAIFGLVAWLAPHLGTRLDERLLRLQLWLTVPFAWLTFPLGVAGGNTGALGAVARTATVALAVPAALGCWNLWTAARTARGGGRAALRWLAFWFAAQAAMELAGALGLADAAVASRHLAILYLHALLVGFVSFGLVLALLVRLGAPLPRLAVALHHGGLLVMAAGLALAGGAAFGLGALAGAGLWLAAAGGAALLLGALSFATAAVRACLRPRPAAALAAP